MIRAALLWLAMAGQAAAWCLSPVQDGAPQKEVEIRQPYRMVDEALTIPGYPWLIIAPVNRFALHTIRNGRFQELGTDYPYAGMWSYRDHYVLSDGTVWGVRWHGRTVHVLRPGQSTFQAVPNLTGFINHEYDPNRERLLLLFEDKGLMEWDGEALTPSPLSGGETGKPLGLNDLMPRYIPALNRYVTGTDRRYYTIPSTPPHDWRLLDLDGMRAQRDIWDVNKSDFRVLPQQRLALFRHHKKIHVYDMSDPRRLTRLYAFKIRGGLIVPGQGRALLRSSGLIPAAFVTRDGLTPVPEDTPLRDLPPDGVKIGLFASSFRAKHQWPPFTQLGTQTAWYDGQTFYRVPPDTAVLAISGRVDWFGVNGKVYALTRDGFYRLNRDLTLHRLIALNDAYGFQFDDLVPSAQFGGFFFYGRERGLWHIQDGAADLVLSAETTRINRYVADVPGMNAGLVLRDDGLHFLRKTCPDHED